MAEPILWNGCYRIRYSPRDPTVGPLEGTLRLFGDEINPPQASGDLYRVSPTQAKAAGKGEIPSSLSSAVDLKSSSAKYGSATAFNAEPETIAIPIFARKDYAYFLRVIQILEGIPGKNDVTAHLEIFEFTSDSTWRQLGAQSAVLSPATTAPSDFPLGKKDGESRCFCGTVIHDDSGEIVGELSIGWISDSLRTATVGILAADRTPKPGEGLGGDFQAKWKEAFRTIGWDVQIETIELKDDGKVSPKLWSLGELHKAMLENRTREADLLDRKWYYCLLCVPLIDGYERGVMFDTGGGDLNQAPREGAAIAADWRFPKGEDDPQEWGAAADKTLHEAATPYFRVAIHEIGHAMGLHHNSADHGFMNTTDAIAEAGAAAAKKLKTREQDLVNKWLISKIISEAPSPANGKTPSKVFSEKASKLAKQVQQVEQDARKVEFPQNVKLEFNKADIERLRFHPDVVVRPGTVADIDLIEMADDEPAAAPDLEMTLRPLLDEVPLGAPVRIQIQLKNTGSHIRKAPRRLGLSSDCASGFVFDSSESRAAFLPMKLCADQLPCAELGAGESSLGSITLLRGSKGALFRTPGLHRVVYRLSWHADGRSWFTESECSVRVTPPADDAHAALTCKIFSTPEVLLSLAIGGDHLQEGNDLLRLAAENTVLGPHFAGIAAKANFIALVQKLDSTDPAKLDADEFAGDVAAACALLTPAIYLSEQERERLAELIGRAQARLKRNDKPIEGGADLIKQMNAALARCRGRS